MPLRRNIIFKLSIIAVLNFGYLKNYDTVLMINKLDIYKQLLGSKGK